MSESRNNLKRILPGLLISILLIAVILYFVDIKTTMDALSKANYVLIGIAFVLSFIWLTVRAIVWRTLLRDKPTFKDVFFTEGEGYLLNNFLPFRLGEIGRAFLLSRKSGGLTFAEIIPTIVIERVVDLIISAVVFLAALPYVVNSESSPTLGYVIGGVMVFGLVLLYILARNNQWALDLFHKLSARLPALQKVGGSFLESFFQGLGVLTDGWLFLRFLFWMILNWAIALLAYYLMVLAFFPDAQPIWAVFGLGMAAFGGAVPSAPGAVGTFEGAVVFALTRFTTDESTAFAAALTMRLYNYLNSTVIGMIGLTSEGQTLSGVYKQLMNFRNKEKAEETS
ncbi:MAG: flippase-like domain-containing protein [Chloroflexi bacterium]|nr:flippase-like domain-containing protein [Chloroflexota bacterium]MBI3167825.1 flippase-like domain-containing protein [Chloroflexota bacterium]